MRLAMATGLILTIALLGFALSNAGERVGVNLFWVSRHADVELSVVVIVSVLIGVVAGGLLAAGRGRTLRAELRRQRRRADEGERAAAAASAARPGSASPRPADRPTLPPEDDQALR